MLCDIQIPIYNIEGNNYISVNEYLRITNSKSIIYEKKKKINIYFNQMYNVILSQNS